MMVMMCRCCSTTEKNAELRTTSLLSFSLDVRCHIIIAGLIDAVSGKSLHTAQKEFFSGPHKSYLFFDTQPASSPAYRFRIGVVTCCQLTPNIAKNHRGERHIIPSLHHCFSDVPPQEVSEPADVSISAIGTLAKGGNPAKTISTRLPLEVRWPGAVEDDLLPVAVGAS